MQRIDVPNGWVDFRDPELVPERLRRPVMHIAPKAFAIMAGVVELDDDDIDAAGDAMSEANFAVLDRFSDNLILCMVTGWSFDLPVTAEGLAELPHTVYKAISEEAKKLIPVLFPSFGVDGATDPNADGGNSSDSAGS